jgi:hypothetical protein
MCRKEMKKGLRNKTCLCCHNLKDIPAKSKRARSFNSSSEKENASMKGLKSNTLLFFNSAGRRIMTYDATMMKSLCGRPILCPETAARVGEAMRSYEGTTNAGRHR